MSKLMMIARPDEGEAVSIPADEVTSFATDVAPAPTLDATVESTATAAGPSRTPPRGMGM